MQDNYQYPAPKDWNLFESLCLILFKSKWENDDLTKYGRQGHEQFGVDISGVPKGEKHYWGIQCKNKDIEGTFNKSTIEDEISKAEDFRPKLEKYYIVTSARRDPNIQTLVATIDEQRRLEEKFPVFILFWDDICEELNARPAVRENYLHACGIESQYSVVIKPLCETISPVYQEAEYLPLYSAELPIIRPYHNLAYCPISIYVNNTGTKPLTNFKLTLETDSLAKIRDTNTFGEFTGNYSLPLGNPPFVNDALRIVEYTGYSVRVGDGVILHEFFMKLPYECSQTTIRWRLLHNSEPLTGEFTIINKPVLKEEKVITHRQSEDGKRLDYHEDVYRGLSHFKVSRGK